MGGRSPRRGRASARVDPVARAARRAAFGVNAWSVENAGDPVIPSTTSVRSSTRSCTSSSGPRALHRRRGRARRARRGRSSSSAIRPSRGAVAVDADTSAVAGPEGQPAVAWEWTARAFQRYQEGDYEAALAGFRGRHERFPATGRCSTTWAAWRRCSAGATRRSHLRAARARGGRRPARRRRPRLAARRLRARRDRPGGGRPPPARVARAPGPPRPRNEQHRPEPFAPG